jgi:hypothetical protein
MMDITDIVRTVQSLPCWRCQDPRGADIRHALAQTGGNVDGRDVLAAHGFTDWMLSDSIDHTDYLRLADR